MCFILNRVDRFQICTHNLQHVRFLSNINTIILEHRLLDISSSLWLELIDQGDQVSDLA